MLFYLFKKICTHVFANLLTLKRLLPDCCLCLFILYFLGRRRMDLALAAAAGQLSQSRPNAAKIVILITTGLQAQVVGMTPLDEASKPLHDANANIFVIGIGKKPDLRELTMVTKNPVEIIPTPDNVIVNIHLWLRQLRQQVNKGRTGPNEPY